MAGISLGGATFSLDADNTQLVGAMVQAKAKAEEASRAIQAAVKAQTDAIKSGSAAATQAAAAQTQAAQGAIQAAQQAQMRFAQMGASAQQASAGIGDLTKGAVGFAVAAAGVATGAALVHQGLTKIAEETQKAAQAQFALQATFKGTAGSYTQFVDQQAAATKRTTTEVKEAVVAFGSLNNRYAISTEQVKELTKRSADLAAVKGGTAVDAAKRLEAAMRGEAEAAESIGLTLNSDYLKKFAVMTDEQRKNWETLGPLQKAQITYNEVLRQTADVQGKAVERANSAAGATDRMKTASSNLALTLGKELTPNLLGIATSFESITEAMGPAVSGFLALQRIGESDGLARIGAILAVVGGNYGQLAGQLAAGAAASRVRDARVMAGISPETAAGLASAYPAGYSEGAAYAAGRDAVNKQREIDAETEKDRVKAALEAADKANDATAESAIRAIDKERKAKETWYDEERQRIEARRTYQLEDIEARRDAELQRLKDVAQAQADADKAEIERLERQRDIDLRVIEAAHDAAVAKIQERADEYKRAREKEDREDDDRRRKQDQQIHDARQAEDHELETGHRDDLRREDARHQQAVDDLDDEGDAAEKAHERAGRALEARARREDDRHRKAVAHIDDETRRALDGIEAQLRALDDADRAEGNADRTAGLNKKVSDAQRQLGLARGSGTPDQVAGARARLTQALRVPGNEIGVANAREELTRLAGLGPEAVRKAEEALAEAQKDLRDEGVKQTRDAERQKLKDAQERIRETAESEKRAEDDKSRARKRDIDESKDAENRKYQDAKDKRDQRREDEQRDHEARVQRYGDDYKEATRLLDLKRQDDDRRLSDQRLAEQRQRDDRRRDEDAFLAEQKRAADQAQTDLRRAAEDHYTGPNGLVTQARKAADEHAREAARATAAAAAGFAAERKAAEAVYSNPEGTGLLQNLQKARDSEMAKLEASKTEWQAWQKQASESIKAAMADLDAFIARGANIPRLGGDNTAQRSPGSGQLTTSSTATTRSTKSGHEVKGDLVSWLNDAIDITGVSGDWIGGLNRLVQLESSGDPHNTNPQDVIDPITGKNLGNAKGLLQMLDDTFRTNRVRSLPNDIFDPVSNAAASINYIRATYGHVDNIPGLREGPPKFKGYADGGWLNEPVLGIGRSGARYSFAEYGPEYVNSIAASSRLLRGGRDGGIDYDRMAQSVARAVASTRPIVLQGTAEDQARRIVAHQRREAREHANLRGVR